MKRQYYYCIRIVVVADVLPRDAEVSPSPREGREHPMH